MLLPRSAIALWYGNITDINRDTYSVIQVTVRTVRSFNRHISRST